MIQRYKIVHHQSNDCSCSWEKVKKDDDGDYVLYADHLEIVRKMEKEIKDLKKEMQRRADRVATIEDYIEGCLV